MQLTIEPFKKCKFCHDLMALPHGGNKDAILAAYEEKTYCSMTCWNKHQSIIADINELVRYCECGKETSKTYRDGRPLSRHQRGKVTTCGDQDCITAAIRKGKPPAKPRKAKVIPIKAFYRPPDAAERFYLTPKPTGADQ